MDLSSLTEKAIRELFAGDACTEELLGACEKDVRIGVRRLAAVERRRQAAAAIERHRLEEMLSYEAQFVVKGQLPVGGVDEVGRGPLAGPVVAACVLMPLEHPISGVNDSKQLSPEKREFLDGEIRKRALGIGLGIVEPEEIDRVNIHRATLAAMRHAVETCEPERPRALLIDAERLEGVALPQVSLVRGDERSYVIACASIVAKVYRDRLMVELSPQYPEYHFAENKGYGTPDHMQALERVGPCVLHRRSFAPVAGYTLPSLKLFLQELGRANSFEALQRAGARIRESDSYLTDVELEQLRRAYRDRQRQLNRDLEES
jgi:ribonuclease HII